MEHEGDERMEHEGDERMEHEGDERMEHEGDERMEHEGDERMEHEGDERMEHEGDERMEHEEDEPSFGEARLETFTKLEMVYPLYDDWLVLTKRDAETLQPRQWVSGEGIEWFRLYLRQQLRELMLGVSEAEADDWIARVPLVKVQATQQTDACNCGVFVMKYMQYLVLSRFRDPESIHLHRGAEWWREELLEDLLEWTVYYNRRIASFL
ncbi:unnamed protein product [Closterium sp. NIES-64]|nr:unnamed protein product [Closterium sp. NIES-65]CAI5989612.1 unnamed protein product [Closterium sp. NIES-64]